VGILIFFGLDYWMTNIAMSAEKQVRACPWSEIPVHPSREGCMLGQIIVQGKDTMRLLGRLDWADQTTNA
jgi:hypothetical protein